MLLMKLYGFDGVVEKLVVDSFTSHIQDDRHVMVLRILDKDTFISRTVVVSDYVLITIG